MLMGGGGQHPPHPPCHHIIKDKDESLIKELRFRDTTPMAENQIKKVHGKWACTGLPGFHL